MNAENSNTPENSTERGMTIGRRLVLIASFLVPVVFVALMLFLVIGLRDNAEDAVANLANLLPVGYAFAAGMVASVNPCGVLLLPSYVFYQLSAVEEKQESAARQALKALVVGGVATAGFVVIFGLVGGIIGIGAQGLLTAFPYAGVAVGGLMVLLGIWLLLTQRTLGVAAAGRLAVRRKRSLGNIFLFGIVYAIGSLSCTLPIFLVVVGGSLASQDLIASLWQFLGYALGMGSILIAVTIGTALFREAVTRFLRKLLPYVHRVSALFLVGSGAYLIYYWIFVAGLG
jgi:cytochrome c biogenesis protein CcdA